MVTITTERLIIRDHVEGDLNDHHKLMSDPEIMSYITDIQTDSLAASKSNLDFSIEESKKGQARQCYFFAIIEKKSNKFIGAIGFTISDQNLLGGRGELGYFILKAYWGRGFTTEAARAVVDFSFNTVKLHKISAGCILENSKSKNIMEKLGMIKEGHFVSHILHQGQWKDRVEYALFKGV